MRTRVVLLLVLAVALAFRIFCFGGVRYIDHIFLARHAWDLSRGEFQPRLEHISARVAFFGPMALLQKTVGLKEWTMAAVPLVASCGMLLLAYFTGRRLGGPRAGMTCLLVLAFLPLDVILATQPFPDATCATLAAAGGVIFLLYPKSPGALLGGGILVGLGYLMKESAAFVLVWPIAMALRMRSLRGLLTPIAGFAIVWVAECTMWWVWTGDPLWRSHAARRQLEFWDYYFPTPSFVVDRLTFAFPKLMWTPLASDSIYFGLFFWLAVGAFWMLRREAMGRQLLLWTALVAAAILVAPLGLRPYRPALLAFARHLYPIVVPCTLAIGWAIARLTRTWRRWLPLGLYLASSTVASLWIHSFQRSRTDGPRDAFREVQARSPEHVYTEKLGVLLLEYWAGFQKAPEVLAHEYLTPEQFKPGLLIDNPQWADSGSVRPKWKGHEPPEWRVLWERPYRRRVTPIEWIRGIDPGPAIVRIIQIPSPPR
jgi:hypothetical protein